MRIGLKYKRLIGLLVIVSIVSYGKQYRVPKKPASVAVADINLDGYPDIVLGHDPDATTNWSGVSILLNDGRGNFTLTDSVYLLAGQIIRVKNVDSNPYPEIFAKSYSYEKNNEYLAVIKNSHLDSISLFPFNTIDGINSYAFCDINYDNNPDIVMISSLGQFWGVLLNKGDGEYAPPIFYNLDFHPHGLAIGDLNGDGRNDIAITNVKIRTVLIYPSGFDTSDIVNLPPYHGLAEVQIADLNDDGKNEIISTDWGMPGTKKSLFVFTLDVNKKYQLTYEKWINEAMASIFVADLNNDNYKDIIYNVSYSYPNSDYELFHTYILFNNKDGTFQDPVNYYTGLCSHTSYVADLNGDGWNDIVTLNSDFYIVPPDTGAIHILFNDGTGKFLEEPITSVMRVNPIPKKFELHQNYPNPFNSKTHLQFSIASHEFVSLKIYDVIGKEVAVLVNENKGIGRFLVEWNAEKLPSGIYFARLQAGNYSAIRKIALIR
jgi:hypothetical protein